MAKSKKRKLSVAINRENQRPTFLINLKQRKADDQEEENLGNRNYFFSNYLGQLRNFFKKSTVNQESLSFRFKSLFPLARPRKQVKISFFHIFRNAKIWRQQLDQFSQAVGDFKKSIPRVRIVNQKKIAKQEKEYILKINWYRRALSFLFVLILLIIPFKIFDLYQVIDFSSLEERVLVHSQAAIDNLLLASEQIGQADLDQAGDQFSSAADNFIAAQEEVAKLNTWLLNLAAFSSNQKIRLAAQSKYFLAAGEAGAQLGKNFSLAFQSLFNSADKNFLEIIDEFVYFADLALINLKELRANLIKIDYQVLPLEHQDQFISWREEIISLESSLTFLLNSAEEIKEFLGYSHDRRYLLVFQNNTEMRGSGGFIGSYALIDFSAGAIKNIEVPAGGTYDTEAGMRTFIRSPRPLWLVNPRWFFWDANWWPDWPTTAENLSWFYEKSDGPTVDGVISFTPDVLAALLAITGPIDLEAEYGLTIELDNFWSLIQSTVEKENLVFTHPDFAVQFPDSPDNQPKKIIGDLMEKLLMILPEKIKAESLPILLASLEKNWQAKNILFYFTDPNLQEKVKQWRLDGAIHPSRHDYLMVVHTNIAGQKSDKKMEEKIFLDSQILNSGRIVNELTIIRHHQGEKNQPLTGARNVDWLRVYVPLGSQLIEASGFSQPDIKYFDLPEPDWQIHPFLAATEELALIDQASGTYIYEEFGKTVLANWVMTDPGETSVIKIRYQLPFLFQAVKRERNHLDFVNHLLNINQERPAVHSLLVQKQPGLKPPQFFSRLRLAKNWQVKWRYPVENSSPDAWLVNSQLTGDQFWAILALPKD